MGIMTEDQPVRRRRSFSPEFKKDAVAMVLDDGDCADPWDVGLIW